MRPRIGRCTSYRCGELISLDDCLVLKRRSGLSGSGGPCYLSPPKLFLIDCYPVYAPSIISTCCVAAGALSDVPGRGPGEVGVPRPTDGGLETGEVPD